ncbi:MAG: tRNA glutamyl-Q(34) synthetase GluQRS [Pseudomonadota bacterium]
MITRFAPSPTGPLHLGHAFSALTVWDVAHRAGGMAMLRIEDTDSTRCRPAWEQGILDDLSWLGLKWPTPVRRQSDHFATYTNVLQKLMNRGLIYPCSCTRKQIIAAGAQPGLDGYVYPGTCRGRAMADRQPGDALRLDLGKAVKQLPDTLSYVETATGAPATQTFRTAQLIETTGDPVLARKETGDPAYHLACVVDDALQNVTHVVRGADLQPLTPLHVLLQSLLGLPTPVYHHHALITDAAGKRLAKIDHSKAIGTYRAEGATVQDIKDMIGWPA